jgi:hypothetical protein
MPSPITAASLAELPGIRHGFFTRAGGVSDGIYASLNAGLGSKDDPAKVMENRDRVCRHLGVRAGSLATLYQVHGTTVLVVEKPFPRGEVPRADALVTRTPGVAVGALAADCTPILFADPEAGVVAAAHAGWRGALAGILDQTVRAMEEVGAARARIRAAIGPTINQPAYEVGLEFVDAFTTADPENIRFFRTLKPGARPRFDLPGYIAARLGGLGLATVERQTLCTYENESQFFSFRRATHRGDGDYGRQISAITVA